MDATQTPPNGAGAVFSVRGPLWQRGAPAGVVRAYRSDHRTGWKKWVAHLQERRRPVAIARLLRAEKSPLLWGPSLPAETIALVDRLHQLAPAQRSPDASLAERLRPWLEEFPAGRPELPLAIESLAWAHALPRLASHLPAELWWELVEHLVQLARDAAALDVAEEPLLHPLLAGELPLALAYHLGVLKACASTTAARRALVQGPLDLLNGEGLPHASDLEYLRPLVACWTRCAAMSRRMDESCFDEPATTQLRDVLLAALRLTRRDGTPTLLPEGATAWSRDFLAAALRELGTSSHRALAGVVLPKLVDGPRPGKRQRKRWPDASYHCNWSGMATLRPTWSRGGKRLTVAYGDAVQVELEAGRHVLLAGEWPLEIAADGTPLSTVGPWEEVCWHRKRRVVYLELERQLTRGYRVQRHILLAPRDGFLFVADAILGERPAALEYAATLPIAPALIAYPAAETREVVLQAGPQAVANVLPLALPEWRIDPRVGQLATTARGLELRQTGPGPHLFAPLLIDLRKRRLAAPLTWRQLTVAETRQQLGPETAAGYRVQIGDEQWLLYRSLAPVGNRTLLGVNLLSEFLVSRFFRDGATRTLVEIE